jgi:hypothetical protein
MPLWQNSQYAAANFYPHIAIFFKIFILIIYVKKIAVRPNETFFALSSFYLPTA